MENLNCRALSDLPPSKSANARQPSSVEPCHITSLQQKKRKKQRQHDMMKRDTREYDYIVYVNRAALKETRRHLS